ncbi:MAG: 4Fe-4S cluster-binding domain-containing protein [Flavobacteriales bacterium]|nr:4Fe-4S cluster-binding domain-containing protein [Flavobacteriales bacterium]
MEHFYTVQGEGANAGRAAYFLRLAGCDVGCPWCDVKESWETKPYQRYTAHELCTYVKNAGAANVVVTGGEPCMYPLAPLTEELGKLSVDRWLETSGSYPITGTWEWVVVSPKRRKSCLPESLLRADELKLVIVRKADLDWALELQMQVNRDCRLYLQPEWERQDEVLPLLLHFVKKYPQFSISLQQHKYMGVP